MHPGASIAAHDSEDPSHDLVGPLPMAATEPQSTRTADSEAAAASSMVGRTRAVDRQRFIAGGGMQDLPEWGHIGQLGFGAGAVCCNLYELFALLCACHEVFPSISTRRVFIQQQASYRRRGTHNHSQPVHTTTSA
jgi:hypothetical protein